VGLALLALVLVSSIDTFTSLLFFMYMIQHELLIMFAYEVRGLPTTYLLDCADNMVGWVMGPWEWRTRLRGHCSLQ